MKNNCCPYPIALCDLNSKGDAKISKTNVGQCDQKWSLPSLPHHR